MIKHIVCFRFHEGVSWADPRAAEAAQITRDHWRHIPEILAWSVGRNTTARGVAFDFALVGEFADRVALDRYMDHPNHQRGVAAWSQLSTWVVVDLDDDVNATYVERSRVAPVHVAATVDQ